MLFNVTPWEKGPSTPDSYGLGRVGMRMPVVGRKSLSSMYNCLRVSTALFGCLCVYVIGRITVRPAPRFLCDIDPVTVASFSQIT